MSYDENINLVLNQMKMIEWMFYEIDKNDKIYYNHIDHSHIILCLNFITFYIS